MNLEYNGEQHSLVGWAEKIGMSYYALYQRLKRGWGFGEAITTPSRRTSPILLTFQGETHTLVEWGKILNVPRSILYNRYKRGWNTEDILTRPVGKRKAGTECETDCFHCKYSDCIK